MNKTKRILMVLTNHDIINNDHPTGLWLEEFVIPYKAFMSEGYLVDVASVRGGEVPIDPLSQPGPKHIDEWSEIIPMLKKTYFLNDLNKDIYDGIVIPGGHGTMFDLPENYYLSKLLSQYAKEEKVIAAICHGPAALVGAMSPEGLPLVANKTITAFTNKEEAAVEMDDAMPFLLETRLRELGADFKTGDMWTDHIEQDGYLITGQNPQSSLSVAQAVIRTLG